MPIDKNMITQEMVTAAMQCKDADELVRLAKENGFDITKDEAEAYMAELADVELDGKELRSVAGGGCYADCGGDNMCSTYYHYPG